MSIFGVGQPTSFQVKASIGGLNDISTEHIIGD